MGREKTGLNTKGWGDRLSNVSTWKTLPVKSPTRSMAMSSFAHAEFKHLFYSSVSKMCMPLFSTVNRLFQSSLWKRTHKPIANQIKQRKIPQCEQLWGYNRPSEWKTIRELMQSKHVEYTIGMQLMLILFKYLKWNSRIIIWEVCQKMGASEL